MYNKKKKEERFSAHSFMHTQNKKCGSLKCIDSRTSKGGGEGVEEGDGGDALSSAILAPGSGGTVIGKRVGRRSSVPVSHRPMAKLPRRLAIQSAACVEE